MPPKGYGRLETNLENDTPIELEDRHVRLPTSSSVSNNISNNNQNVNTMPVPVSASAPEMRLPQQPVQPVYITQNGGNYPHIQQQQHVVSIPIQQSQAVHYPSVPSTNANGGLHPQPQVQYVVQNNQNAQPPFQPQILPQARPVGQQQAPAAPGQGHQLVAVRPPPPTIEQFNNIINERRVNFEFCKYNKEAWNYMKFNCCSTFGVMCVWIAFMILFFILTIGFTQLVDPNQDVSRMGWGDDHDWYDWYDYNYPDDYDEESGYSYDESDSDVFDSDFSSSTSSYYSYVTDPYPYYSRWGWHDDCTDRYGEYDRDECEDRERSFLQILGIELFKFVLQVLLFFPLISGFIGAVMKSMRDNTHLRVKDTFMSFKVDYYFRLLPLSITLYVVGVLLFILLIIPGIWWNVATAFALIIHRDHQFSKTSHAIKYSIRKIHSVCCNFFLFALLLAVINIAGFLALGVGALFTIPFSIVASIYCYHHLIGVNGVTVYVPMSAPSLQPPNAGNPSGRHVWIDAI